MGRIKDGMWQQGKEIVVTSLLYIGLFVLASFIDRYLGSKNSEGTKNNQIWIFRYLIFLVVFCHILMRKDFKQPGVPYIDTKWVQILGDLVTSSVVLLIAILILAIIFACSSDYRKKQAEFEEFRRNVDVLHRNFYYYCHHGPILDHLATAYVYGCGFPLLVVLYLAGAIETKHFDKLPKTVSEAQKLAEAISVYLLMGFMAVIIVSIIFLIKHIVQLMGAYIVKGIKRIDQWSISKNENEAAIINRKED